MVVANRWYWPASDSDAPSDPLVLTSTTTEGALKNGRHRQAGGVSTEPPSTLPASKPDRYLTPNSSTHCSFNFDFTAMRRAKRRCFNRAEKETAMGPRRVPPRH